MINSTSNKQVKRVANLRDKAKARREEGVYVAEGLRMCREYKPDDVEILSQKALESRKKIKSGSGALNSRSLQTK